MVKALGAVGGLASKLGHCGHGVRQRTLHTPAPVRCSTPRARRKLGAPADRRGRPQKKIIAKDIRATALRSSSTATERRDGRKGERRAATVGRRCLIQTARQSSTTFYRKIMIRFCQIPLVSHLHAAILLLPKIYGAPSLRCFLGAASRESPLARRASA